ncbi:NAD(P)-dependent oxidoreductase [Lichenicola cladoniae]|uniref:NAD(P)-dependent oxidoreductase n=1 Tax=Lichenicola cladoniae TaxID=1484109 RepID=UPI001EF68748|nr:NAD(P)-binding domain-containing protein [Lichenicola cladoniae]
MPSPRGPAKTSRFVERGASSAANPAAAARVDTVFTMLANDDALEAVAFGDAGLLAAGPGILHVSCSTVTVALTNQRTEAHAAAGQRLNSAQVLGRPDVAASGELAIISAGPAGDLDRAQPFFDAIGSKTLRVGDRPAMAAAAKATVNFGIAAIIETISEQMRIAAAQGVSHGCMAELLIETDFGARIFASYAPMIAEQHFEPAGFPLRLGRKDIGLAIMNSDGAELPLANLLATRMDAIIEAGGGERDWSSLGQPVRA